MQTSGYASKNEASDRGLYATLGGGSNNPTGIPPKVRSQAQELLIHRRVCPKWPAPLSLSCADVSSEKTRNMSTRRTADTETYSRDDLDFSSTKWTESEHYESCSTSSHGDLRSSPLEVLDVLGITDREREALFSYCRSDGLREAGNRVHRDERHLRPPKRVRMVSPSPEPPEGEHEQFEEWVCRSFDELFSGARRDWTLA
ncbi:hypothetical protein MRS44_016002 [Fusarium solani]|uniref:uncharacterized protein n=1 Tax=Fusarium solani TaxID=169388 RepID=UPI0032C40129|nr:hypothetical protein MRS44_016002 [Fusarium solani]